MLFQPSNISPDEINSSGTVDLTKPLTISWQVNGDSAMLAYQIVFYANDTASTQKYDTGKVLLTTPFWGVNYAGQTQFFAVTIPAATLNTSGITNGSEYKFIITQWWSASDSVAQSTASLIVGRSTPSVSISAISSPLTGYSYSFTGSYSQAQGDALAWVRWRICEVDSDGNRQDPFLDTGKIYGTGELRVDYSGFLNDTSYSIILDVETAGGMDATSGWVDFNVEYEVSEDSGGQASACQTSDGCVLITWAQIETTQGYDIYRRTSGQSNLEKIATVSRTVGEIRDWSACSGQQYTYYVFPTGPLAYLSRAAVTNAVNVQFWMWNIIEASPNADGTYSAIATYFFRFGSGGVAEGQFSNNNSPTLQKNFTRYPTRQPETPNYLTGSVGGFIGKIGSDITYSDTLAQARALRNLSTSENALFLRDPKGHFLNIHTNQPVTVSVDHKSTAMPQTVTIGWAEVGETTGIKIISTPEDTFWPVDSVIFTTVTVDPSSGQLIWTTEENYETGSVLSLSDGQLIQTTGEGYIVAGLEITDTNKLQATVNVGG